MYGDSRWNAAAALPTGESINPLHPQGATYYDPGQTAYVLFKRNEARTRPTRVFTTFGSLGWKLGTVAHLQHDQTGAYLGEYEVVGVHDFASGEMAGNVPDLRIKHCVAK